MRAIWNPIGKKKKVEKIFSMLLDSELHVLGHELPDTEL